jgi:hypothetical protein
MPSAGSALLLAACPSFLPAWRKIETADLYIEDGSRSDGADSAEPARHLVEPQRTAATAQMSPPRRARPRPCLNRPTAPVGSAQKCR